ncbi:hypothetical protein FQN57_006026 [Myotisia sp. PD_48]|nr:hypothetical protein FQN57_006026 [Myotisia sp. PD_48]
MTGEDSGHVPGRSPSVSVERRLSRSPLRNSSPESTEDDRRADTIDEDISVLQQPGDGQRQTRRGSEQRELTIPGRELEPSLHRRSSHQRVRFSSDLERLHPPPPTDEPVENISSESGNSRTASARLTVDTTIQSSITSPPLPPTSATRNRGYSLRRSLFNRNLSPRTEEIAPTELQQNTEPVFQQISDKSPENGVIRPTSEADEKSTTFSDSTNTLKCSRLNSIAIEPRRLHLKSLFHTWLAEILVLFQKHILRIKEIPPSADGRKITLNAFATDVPIDERTGNKHIGNTIRSSRYSLWSFFPRQLIAQFSKLANFYFLVVAVLQMIPGLSTTGTFTTFVPLMIFVGIAMGKEGFDDFRRYRLDKEENNRMASVLRPSPSQPGESGEPACKEIPSNSVVSELGDSGYWTQTKWIDIQVGDIIKLTRNQPAPADLVLLHADEPNGIAYIETMALDGETNLKSKKACPPVAKRCSTVEDILANKSTHFAVEDPNIDLYKFEGNVTVDGEKIPLTNTEVIYRGSILRNTAAAIGMVIYTGEECKIRMNATKNPRIKAPALQSVVNRVVAVIVLFVVILAGACTIAYRYWAHDVERTSWYLERANVSYGPIFTSFLIMFNTMIPISLYVSLEIVKVAQMLLLNDVDMYDEASNTPLEARTSTINEELGQVSYVFSDKTGTLTDNSMRFRKLSVAGTAWLHDPDLVDEAADEANTQAVLHRRKKGNPHDQSRENGKSRMSGVSRPSGVSFAAESKWKSNRKGKLYHGGKTTQMLQYIAQKPHTIFAKKVRFFIIALALCHTCLPERDEDDGDISFQAASPDEVALVLAAKELGYLVFDRQPNSITIRKSVDDDRQGYVEEVYEVLDIIEFTSSRKRMSIVIRMPDQRICIFTKGADSAITGLLRQSSLAAEKILEIERQASKRKAMEAMEIIRRNSEHMSHGKKSLSLHRPSFAIGRRSSVSGKHRPSMRQSIDVWLRDRETDGGMDLKEDGNENYSPRPSMQIAGRGSSIQLDPRASFQSDEYEELVEEALVVNEALVFERCFQHLNDFATEGLRTLLYGYRYIGESEYDEWKQSYKEASVSLVNRQEKIEQAGEQLESQLELIGATAIEDKLQKGVPDTIDKLRRANIKLWMLTGDKRETAVNIGHSCRLVKDYSSVIVLDYETGTLEETIISTTNDLLSGNIAHSVIVVDGKTLSIIESDELLREKFFTLAIGADSVICCRASPKQKAFLVRSIRKRVNKSITLAIGDGANDIAMIQEAHVGIGITGKEGLQAARISDYSIAQFRFLLKLLLVHGRWNYDRVCKYTLGTFWKETLFYLTQALYQRWNGYTGTSLYEPWGLSMFNTLFTSLPVIFLGIFEKDLAPSTLIAVPELYTRGQRNEGFNIKVYLAWAFMGAGEAMVVYFTMFGLFGQALFTLDSGVFAMGLLTYSACVVIINLKLQGIEIHDHSVMAAISIFLSVGGWWLWNLILSGRYQQDPIYNVRNNFIPITGRNLLWWVVLLVAIMAVILLEITVATIRATLFSTDVDLFQLYEKDPEIRKRFEEASAAELQQGWDCESKRKSGHQDGGRNGSNEDDGGEVENDDEAREMQVQQLLDRRRREAEQEFGISGTHGGRAADSAVKPRQSSDMHELFSKGYGAIQREQDIR